MQKVTHHDVCRVYAAFRAIADDRRFRAREHRDAVQGVLRA
jgi:hypothetical protein